MKTLFAMRYEIGPKDTEIDLFHSVQEVCRYWIHNTAGRYAPQVAIPSEREYTIERDRVRLESWYYESAESETMHRLLLDHPDVESPFLQWKVDVAILKSCKSEVSIRIKIDIAAIDDSITVPQYTFDRPKLVTLLLEKFKLTYGGYPVTDKAIRIRKSDLDKLEEFIFLESRDFPIVIISPLLSGDLAIDTTPVVRRLTGMAYVCVFDSPATANEFRAKVGYEWSCYNGAVRIYWPKARKFGNSKRHQFWPAYELRSIEPEALAKRLLTVITEAAAFGSASEKDVTRIEAIRRKSAETRSDERIAQLRTMLDKEKEHGSHVVDEKEQIEESSRRQAEWTKLLEAELADKEAIKKENQDLHQLLREKESQIEHLRYALDQSSSNCEETDAGIPETLEEAVSAVKQLSDDAHLVILPSALSSAKDSRFRNPEKVYKALLGLSHAAKLYHLGIESKHPADLLRAVCQMEVSSDISPTARGKYGRHYEFMYNGEKIVAGPHLGSGRGGANDCFRAYWYVDEEKKQYVLCHVGEHLPDDTKN